MSQPPLADSGFLVLALLAEGPTHGYEIQRLAQNRGFRFWTQLQRSSIYNALSSLDREGLVSARVFSGEGPDRKVYRLTKKGAQRLRDDAYRHLSDPSHPRHELDLGIYAVPFMSAEEAQKGLAECQVHLAARREFLKERLNWCRERGLRAPALAFERPLLVLDAELEWLKRVAKELARGGAKSTEWSEYVYREPPSAESSSEKPQSKSRRKQSESPPTSIPPRSSPLRVSMGSRKHR